MGNCYGQLSLNERIEIYRFHREGRSARWIARFLGRSGSTVSRELRRNSVRTRAWPGGYDADRAHRLAERRRCWDCRFKLARQPDLRRLVRDRLAMGWSPEQIAGRLAREQRRTVISHESIYRYIYHRSAQKDYWHRLLPRAKSRRGRLGRRGGSPIRFFKEYRSIAERPPNVAARSSFGHWEADLMLFARYGQAVLITHERRSRLLLISRQPNKAAGPRRPQSPRTVHRLARQPAPNMHLRQRHRIRRALAPLQGHWNENLLLRPPCPLAKGRHHRERQSADCDAPCPEKPTSPSVPTAPSTPMSGTTTIRRESASPSEPPPRYSPKLSKRCTSTVRPPSRLRGNDASILGRLLRLWAFIRENFSNH